MILEKRSAILPADRERIEPWITQSQSKRFNERRQGTEHSDTPGLAAEPRLRRRLHEKPTLEARRRIERILEGLNDREWNRARRAVEVLRLIGNTQAKRVVKRLSQGDKRSRVTEPAERALHAWP